MKYLLILLALSTNGWTHEDPVVPDLSCVPVQKNSIHKLLEWWGADDKQIQNAPCKTKTPPLESEMDQLIASKAKGATNESVHGVSFKNESPALIKAFKELTTAKDPYGISDAKNLQKALQAEYKINPACDKVMCAVEKIWGKDLAKKLMFIKLKHNFNSSELAFQNSDRFTVDEINDVIMGLEDLPSHLIPLGAANQRMTHFKRGYTLAQYKDGRTVANAVVMLFDLWDEKPSATRQYTIFHELSHNISTKLKDMDESPEWLKLSGWVKKGEDWESKPGTCFISNYGKANPWEDYAETLSSYRYNGATLEKTCPEKYNFIKKNVYKGVEYTDLKTCSPIPPEKLQMAQKAITDQILESIGKETFSEDEIKAACKNSFNKYPLVDMEVGACSMKLHSTRAADKIDEALKKAGIADTASNRELVLNSLSELFVNDINLSVEITNKSTGVADSINQIVGLSFSNANSAGFSKKGVTAEDYRWRTSMKDCGLSYFTGQPDEVVSCQIKSMMKTDRDMQKWDIGIFPAYKFPDMFNESAHAALVEKREEALFNHLKEQPVATEAAQKQKLKFKEDLGYHHLSVSNRINSMNEWKKMSPEDFCKSTYGGGSSWTENYGVAPDARIPKIYDRCVQEQSKKSKRFEFKEKDWKSIVDSL